MDLVFEDCLIQTKEFVNHNEFEQELQLFEERSIVLGAAAEAPRRYDLISIRSSGSDGANVAFAVGVVSSSSALRPTLLIMRPTGLVLIGYNSEASVINLRERKTVSHIQSEGVHFCFVDLTEVGVVLIVHELGIIALDGYGVEKWRITRDILTRWRTRGSIVFLEFFDGEIIQVDASIGKT